MTHARCVAYGRASGAYPSTRETQMKHASFCAGAVALAATLTWGAHAESSSSSSAASSDGKTTTTTSVPNSNCRTVHLKPGEKPPNSSTSSAGGMTSSVTAGNGSVSGSTTGAGPSVSTQAGPGSG